MNGEPMSDSGAESTGKQRFYTLNEARATLAEVVPLLEELRDLKARLDTARVELEHINPAMRSNGHGMKAMVLEREMTESAARIVERASMISGLGIEVKDLDQGIIDFPALRDGRVIFLCYRLGEPDIQFWHEIDGGFAGRQPL